MAYKNPKGPRRRYIEHRANAQKRRIPFLLSFEEWWEIWQASGKWDRRGNRRGRYCMARYSDQGAYEVGNVSICLIETNRAERNFNYPMTGDRNPAAGKDYWAADTAINRRRRQLVSKQFKGKRWSDERRAKMIKTITGRRRVLRNGLLSWAYPGDPDYPNGGTF